MNFLTQFHTDVGIKKDTNQDSLCIVEAETEKGKELLTVICDGMGGLEKGELASSVVINAFSDWFKTTFPALISEDDYIMQICLSWQNLINSLNTKILLYGKEKGIKLGTTITALLFFDDGNFLIAHVGDSRVYRIYDNKIKQLTIDQTVVERDVKRGLLKAEEADNDPRRSVLLQCVGASEVIDIDFRYGTYSINECYLMCTDGFRHVITADEIKNALCSENNNNETEMKGNLEYLVELNKNRLEKDNISAILVKII